jgi:hypothetical protein
VRRPPTLERRHGVEQRCVLCFGQHLWCVEA